MRQWPSHHTTDRPKAQFAALAELRRSGSREVAAAAVEARGRDVVSGAGDVVVRRVGGEGKLPAELMLMANMLPDSKVVMGRAKRGIYAGRHIQFGNKVSEDGGNK